jgi:hypothetical protein
MGRDDAASGETVWDCIIEAELRKARCMAAVTT